jgi:hypothetical protein
MVFKAGFPLLQDALFLPKFDPTSAMFGFVTLGCACQQVGQAALRSSSHFPLPVMAGLRLQSHDPDPTLETCVLIHNSRL